MNTVFYKNRSMLIVIWLIAMQLVAPFIHGHPSGIGAVTGVGIHLHVVDDLDVPKHAPEQPVIQTEVIHQHIVAVASGIAEKLKVNLITAALLLTIVWAFFNTLASRYYSPLASPFVKPPINRTRPSRAPPTPK
ncbi:MAG: hypothetical protein ACXW1P_11245 [Methylophilaceae bacterium]